MSALQFSRSIGGVLGWRYWASSLSLEESVPEAVKSQSWQRPVRGCCQPVGDAKLRQVELP